MKKLSITAIITVIVLSLAFLLTSCAPSNTAPIVTGVEEEGELVVWLSPYLTSWKDSTGEDKASEIASYTDFADSIKFVEFDNKDEYKQAITQKLLSGEAPDLILASDEEISFKAIESKAFKDLTPYLEYEFSREGGLRREDLLSPDFDGLKYKGALYLLPLDYIVRTYYTTETLDSKYGLDIIGENPTFEEFYKKVKEWKKPAGDINYKLASYTPSMREAFPDLFDFEKKTTRLGEELVYEYFCFGIPVDSGNSSGKSTTNPQKKETIYTFCSMPDIKGSGGDGEAYIENRIGDYVCIPIPTGDGKTYVRASLVGMIPQAAQRPQKAFNFLKTAYTQDFGMMSSMQEIPFNKKAIWNLVEFSDRFGAEDKEEVYARIVNRQYAFTLSDIVISRWMDELYYKCYNEKRIPTKAEWAELVNKVKIYLGE